jgi:LuxR family transcriptional regulator of spore coat protein
MKNIITKREKEIFQLLIENKSTKEISNILNISEKTVRNHISNVMQKLDVINRSNAIIELLKLNEIKIKNHDIIS